MRLARHLALIAAVLAAAGPVRADGGGDRDDDFWASMADPHAEEVAICLQHARANRALARTMGGTEWGVAQSFALADRDRDYALLSDAFFILRYARTLSPDDLEVLFELGRTADDIGRTDVALDALRAYVERAPARRVNAEARLRLGRLYAARGQWEAAAQQLRLTQLGPGRGFQGRAMFDLAQVYAHLNRLDDAIDVLLSSANNPFIASGYYEPQALQFGLAVAYDKADQITQSHRVLAALLSQDPSLDYALGPRPDDAWEDGGDTRFFPAHESHYYRALRYEALGYLQDAREEWLAYARSAGDGPFVARALDHVHSIDAMLARGMTR